ncbi:Eco57I restriction-modification methylase domain-containing protein [Candidatus Neomarinimicrobiota bacterium]
MIKIKSSDTNGVVFTDEKNAQLIVSEALYYKLRIDFSTISKRNYNYFIEGQTPLKEASAIVNQILKYRFIDPAVGKGVFIKIIVQLIDQLAKYYNRTIESDWWQNHVIGWDINPELTEYCKNIFGYKAKIINKDFLLESENYYADIIFGNPPYIRQELLDMQYKFEVVNNICVEIPGIKISKRSDLYIYFILKCFAKLNPEGICTLIIPNSWMSTKYGEVIRGLLKSNLQLLSIQDSLNRHFNESINTVIITVLNKNPKPENKIELSVGDETKEINQYQLDAIKRDWNGSLFNCPTWLLDEINTNTELINLGDTVKISTGIITGNNKQYYKSKQINGSFVKALRSPKDYGAIQIEPSKVTSWLKIKNVPYKIKTAPIVWPDLRGGRHFVGWNRYELPFEHTFYGLTPSNKKIVEWVMILNSSWVWLMVELFGRKALGGGAIRLVKSELLKLPVPNPEIMEIPKRCRSIMNRPIENWQTELKQSDRFVLDQTVFNFLGLEKHLNECVHLLQKLINMRYHKAGLKQNG